ncbi:hypothetical protein, partial [Klebsiella pneumoniae]|uniref:hypothetical protein n=1 Tax=Klebsiella pneumoniae TaxID=573 RepID=UPI001B8CE131
GCNPTSSKFIHTWLRFGEIMRGSLSAGLLHIKTKVELSFGPFALCGEGIFQTVFAIHPSAVSDDDYLFDFSSAG